MRRTTEPELMCSPQQVLDFASGNKSYSIKAFLEQWETYVRLTSGSVIDLGCGPAEYISAISDRYPNLAITGYDGSQTMIDHARRQVQNKPIQVFCINFDQIRDNADVVISTNTLHHQHDPESFWEIVNRLGKKILVTDMLRPETHADAELIVSQYAANEPEGFKQDFYQSLLASFTEEEIRQQVEKYPYDIKVVSGRYHTLKTIIIHSRWNLLDEPLLLKS